MHSRLLILILTVVTTSLACEQDDQLLEISVVEPELQPYFLEFQAEAAERGISITAAFADISAEIVDISDDDVIGQCRYSSARPNEVRIDQAFWNRASETSREHVVFHELGHCYLSRDHKEARTLDGTCVSIMASGRGDCTLLYSSSTREAYLDELFFGE